MAAADEPAEPRVPGGIRRFPGTGVAMQELGGGAAGVGNDGVALIDNDPVPSLGQLPTNTEAVDTGANYGDVHAASAVDLWRAGLGRDAIGRRLAVDVATMDSETGMGLATQSVSQSSKSHASFRKLTNAWLSCCWAREIGGVMARSFCIMGLRSDEKVSIRDGPARGPPSVADQSVLKDGSSGYAMGEPRLTGLHRGRWPARARVSFRSSARRPPVVARGKQARSKDGSGGCPIGGMTPVEVGDEFHRSVGPDR